MDLGIEQYTPFPPSLRLVVLGDSYSLVCEKTIPTGTCLGMTSVYVSRNMTSVRTPLGAFVEKSQYDYNCCVRSGDLKTYHLWTLREIAVGETIMIW